MGVHGLWRLIEPSGKPVPLETLENKVLAVDISIWLHQAIKGFQDSKGAPIPNAHLLGIYHRLCKLLYFKIKPVFVFDGGVPVLKKQTIAKRNQQKSKNNSDADRLQKQLLNTLMKHTAISKVLSESTKASLTAQSKKQTKQTDNLYALPSAELDSTISSSDEEEATSESTDSSPTKNWDLHTIDMNSVHFKSLPVDVRHEILTELKETRKQNSWGRLHELPKQSDDFSVYQMKRLLKRQAVQAALEEAAQEMGGMSLSLAELESILKDQGIQTTTDNIGKRIASDENTRYLFIRDVKLAMEKARQAQLNEEARKTGSDTNTSTTETVGDEVDEEAQLQQAIKLSLQETPSSSGTVNINDEKCKTKADVEEEEQLEQAIALSLQETQSTSGCSKERITKFSYLDNELDRESDSDSDEESECSTAKKLSSAASYMMEYSGLTPYEISKIIEGNAKIPKKNVMKKPVNEEHIVFDSLTVKNSITSKEPVQESELQPAYNHENSEAVVVSESEETQIHLKDNTSSKTANEPQITEIMSDSDESSTSSDFQEVTEMREEKSSMEIIIDLNEGKDDDDIFEDIFANNEVIQIDRESTENKHQSNSNNREIVKIGELIKTPTLPQVENDHPAKQQPSEKTSNIPVSENDVVKEIESEINNKEVLENSEIINKMADKEQKNNISTEKSIKPTLTIEEMTDLKDCLQKEKTDLLIEKSTKERLASNITDQMYQEAQELLELFGVPYIIAPMEAEAQCAFLDEIELTDGTITDDSDVWLFGGRTVYKNFFNQSKYVMEFKSENIQHNFKLSREQMILLALLVGSDYTTGISGIGPVTALEILSAFPPAKGNEFSVSHGQLISGLREFRSWFTKGKTGGPNRSTLKNKLKNIAFTDNFPSPQVVQAYLEPTVEDSREKFSWDKPDVVALKFFAKEKFGWSSIKTDEILNPVIKKLEENRSQKSIREYFKTKFKADSGGLNEKISKRVKTAIERFGKSNEELIAEEMEELEREKQKVLKKSQKNKSTNQQRKRAEADPSERPSSSRKQKASNEKVPNIPAGNKKTKQTVDAINEEKVVKKKTPSSTTSDNKKTRKKKRDTKMNDKNVEVEKMDEIITESVKPVDELKESSMISHNKKTRMKKGDTKMNDINTEVEKIDEIITVKPVDELKEYENLAAQLRMRRKKRNELMKLKQEELPKKKTKLTTLKQTLKEPEMDEEVKLLIATTSKSLQREQEIKEGMKKHLDRELSKRNAPSLHKEEIIHQRLRNRSDLLNNKLKAIEVFRKSKKGPGYVPKRGKKQVEPKEDAGLSEESDE